MTSTRPMKQSSHILSQADENDKEQQDEDDKEKAAFTDDENTGK